MAIGSTSRQNSFAIKKEKCHSWDPFATLGIINPDTKSFTCVGFAPSQRRRCRIRVAQCNENAAFAIIEALALLSPSSSKIGPMLREIASLCLCRCYHQNQAESVAAKWRTKISSLKLENIRTKSWLVYEDPDSLSSRPINSEKKNSSQMRQPFSERGGENVSTSKKNSKPRTYGEQEESEKEYHERKERERYKMEEQLKEEKNKEEERKHKEQRERRRRDEEKFKQQRKEKEQHDRAAQNERIRQAAQKKREEQERQRQELIAKEKKEWQKSWATFTSRWAAFKETKNASTTKETIPWPVKSGRYTDLQASAVRTFFQNACPDADAPARMYNTLQAECLKWHPDKAPGLFPGFTVGVAEREVLLMICRVVLELKKEVDVLRQAALE